MKRSNVIITFIFTIFVVYLLPLFAFNSNDGLWEYDVREDNTAEIIIYKGNSKEVNVPDNVDGKIVTAIGDNVFEYTEIEK